jgi:hypothetical protein
MIPMKLYRLLGRPAVAAAATLTVAFLGSVSTGAQEDVAGRSARGPLQYAFEIEPHLVAGTAPPGFGQGSGIGAGLRGGVVILRNGLIPNVNDSLALGFGLDYGHYHGNWSLSSGWRDQCLHYEVAPTGTQMCTDATLNGGTYTYLYIPVVVQWNFGLARGSSVFVEPGVDIYYLRDHGFNAVPAGYLGGRIRLSDRVALTLRLGYPTLSIGASFML